MTTTTAEPGLPARLREQIRHTLAGNRGDLVFKSLALVFTLLIVVLAVMLVFEVARGARESIAEFGFFSFVASTAWDPVFRDFGAAHVIAGTLISSIVALLIALPIAVGIALFITEMAPPWLRGPVAFLVDILAAIPSIVYGLWGFFVMVPWMRSTLNPLLIENLGWTGVFARPQFGVSLLAASLILAIMIIPIVSAVSREVIFQVPQTLPEGMLALGATKWETIWQVILPSARTGIAGAAILGLARAIGETMAVTAVIGNAHHITTNLLAPNSTMASLIANEFREATYDLHVSALIHVGLVVMLIALLVNMVARALVWSVARRTRGQVR